MEHWFVDAFLFVCLMFFALDSLTFLWVRRCYDLFYHITVKTKGHLVFIDIDDFKQFNDRYGHPTGDRVLRKIGRIVMKESCFRGFRYGGDEFAVLLPWTSEQKAFDIASGIKSAVAAISINGLQITVTCVVARCEEAASKLLRQCKNDRKAGIFGIEFSKTP